MRGFICAFKFRDTRWVIRAYKKNGKQKYCYSPNSAYNPIFTDKLLTNEEFAGMIDKQDCKWRN